MAGSGASGMGISGMRAGEGKPFMLGLGDFSDELES
jgi:hypothetical protein